MKVKEDKNMDFDEIKKLIKLNRERIIVVENGKPVVVLVSFEEYQKNFRSSEENSNDVEGETPDDQIKDRHQEKKEKDKRELTIEDLPF